MLIGIVPKLHDTKENGVVSAEMFLDGRMKKRGDWTHNQECGERAMDDFNNQK